MNDENKSREQLIRELQESREQLRSIQESQKDAVQKLQEERQIFLNGPTVVFQWENAPGWPVKYASPNVKEVFGYSAEDFLEERISYAELLFSEDIERATGEVQKASESGAPHFEHLPYRITHKNGQLIWLYDFTTILRDANGAITHYLGYVTNITERKLAEERYRSMTIDVLDKLDVGILIADSHNNVIWLNKKMNIFFGIPCTEILGQSRTSLFQQYIRPLLEDPQIMDKIYLENRSSVQNLVCHLLAKQEFTERWMEYRLQPISTGLYAGGQTELYYDITLLKNAENERKQMELQLLHAQKLESLGILSGGIAHDFNNLLTGILGNAGFIRLNIPKNSEFESPLQDIESASIRAAELCKQMLAYSGKGKFLIEPINLNHLIQEITHLLEISISKKVVIRYHFSKNLPLIEADATQIRQIIMNLITNASDAIAQRSGEIIVKTGVKHCSPETFGKLNFTEKQEEGFYIFAEIEDTGCGIDEESKKKIFDPFFTTKFAGRGLGLSAVLGIVRSHHGAIQVESIVGKGSKFRILFPYSSRVLHLAENATPLSVPLKKASGSVLVIDDEQTVRDVATRILTMAGFKVIEASLGKEGVQRFQQAQQEIRMVLLDLTMPEQSGVETFVQLRAIQPQLPILVSSGYNVEEVSELLQNNKNTAGFVQKPYLPEALLTAIQKLVPC